MILTVILRNDGPMIFCGDSPAHRSVQIELTPEQCEAIKPRRVGTDCGREVYEAISMAFIEPNARPHADARSADSVQADVGLGRACVRCGKRVEKVRECYALPTCYACLPPPEPLEIIEPNAGGQIPPASGGNLDRMVGHSES
jgi:hypothetical protein